MASFPPVLSTQHTLRIPHFPPFRVHSFCKVIFVFPSCNDYLHLSLLAIYTKYTFCYWLRKTKTVFLNFQLRKTPNRRLHTPVRGRPSKREKRNFWLCSLSGFRLRETPLKSLLIPFTTKILPFSQIKEEALCNGKADSTQSLIATNPAVDSPTQQRSRTSFVLSKRNVKKWKRKVRKKKKKKGKTKEKALRNFESI
jgi:hypothetical protein